MSYLGSWKIDDLLTFPALTSRFDTGAATDADSVPSYRVYEDETSTAILTGSMALLDSSNTAGFYSEQITLSAANGFEKGKCYTIYIQATVNSVVGATYHTFQMEAEVDANRVNWANVDGATTTNNLSGTTVKAVTDRVTANTDQIEGSDATNQIRDSVLSDATRFAGADIATIKGYVDDIGVAGAGLSALPWNAAWDGEVQSEVQDAIEVNNLDHLVKVAVDTDFPTTVHLNSVVGYLADNGTSATFDRTTDSLEAIRDKEADIEADTQDIQSRLPAALVDSKMDSFIGELSSSVIADMRSLFGTSTATSNGSTTTLIDGNQTGWGNDEFVNCFIRFDSYGLVRTVIDYDDATGTFTFAPALPAYASTLSGDTYEVMPHGYVNEINSNGQGNIRTAMGLASDNLDNQLSTIDDFLDTEIAAIKAKTDNLPSDPADASDIAASFASVASTLTTIASYIDTEIAAIKTKTDNLPASPAATGDIPSTSQITTAIFAGLMEGKSFEEIIKDIWGVTVGDAVADDPDEPTEIVYEGPDGSTQITHEVTDTTRTVA